MLKGILLLVLAVSGCFSFDYRPRTQDPRAVRVVIQYSDLALVKGDRVIPVGWTGGGLVDAVRDNPAALKWAKTYRRRRTIGTVVAVLSGACTMSLGMDWLDRYSDREAVPKSIRYGTYGCFVGLLGAIAYEDSGRPYLYDAINKYNDDL